MINIKLRPGLFLILWFNFIFEIGAMQKTIDNPHAAGHIGAQDRFLDELTAMPGSLSEVLYKWLNLQVLGSDQKLEDFALKSTTRSTPLESLPSFPDLAFDEPGSSNQRRSLT